MPLGELTPSVCIRPSEDMKNPLKKSCENANSRAQVFETLWSWHICKRVEEIEKRMATGASDAGQGIRRMQQ